VQPTERNLQQKIDDSQTECRNMVAKISGDFEAVVRDFDQVKKASAEAVRTVNKCAAIATQPQPAMIREIQERMLNVSNLVLSGPSRRAS
jgi:hypothetical protein